MTAGTKADAPTTRSATETSPLPLIRIEGVDKTFGEGDLAVHALRDADLEVEAGQFVVVLGPSGSGKTTLINVVGGIEPVSAGRVMVADTEVSALDERALTEYRRRDVGFVFQYYNLIPTLSARENVALVGELVGVGPEVAVEVLEEVGLKDKADRFPANLSGGEQQRVGIARALVKRPALLLLDEPTGSLDLESGRNVLAVLHQAARTYHSTVLLVTHNSEIARMADRVVHLHSGKVVEDQLQATPVAASELRW